MNYIENARQDHQVTAMRNVCLNYGKIAREKTFFDSIRTRIVNAVKSIFGRSDWQIARCVVANYVKEAAGKDSQVFNTVVFPGQSEDLFSTAEIKEIAEKILIGMTNGQDSGSSLGDALNAGRTSVVSAAAEVLYRKVRTNSSMLPGLDIESLHFQMSDQLTQSHMIMSASHTEETLGLTGVLDQVIGTWIEEVVFIGIIV